MKKLNLFTTTLIALLVFTANIVFAQSAGPSDATSAAPTNPGDAGKIECYGSPISLSGPQDAGGVDYTKYHWYKIDASGTAQLVTAMTGRTYTEASGAKGYYNYQVVTENANGCTSPISDVFKIYVLPQLTVAITTPASSICAVASSATLLTANPTFAAAYPLSYQWTRNGVVIPGATSATYNVTGETSAATVTFGVTVSFSVLGTSCSTTSTQDIIVTPLPTKPLITAN